MPRLLLALIALFPLFAYAGDATLSWAPPTQSVDGSTLTNLAGYRIYYGTSDAILDRNIQLANAGLTTYKISGLSSATWYFAMTAYTSVGDASDFSPVLSKAVTDVTTPPPPPPPPALVTTSTVAYMLIPGADTYAPLIVGSVPLGTPCDASKALLGYYIVPRASVTFTGPIQKTPAVVGVCR
jgi:hypothetical protein